MPEIQGYCVSCKAMRDLTDTSHVHRSGLPALAGKCAVCGSKIFVLGAGASPPPDESPDA